MTPESIRIEDVRTESKFFAYTRWDAIPVLFGVLHFAYFWLLFYLFPRAPLWVMLLLAGVAALCGVALGTIEQRLARSKIPA